jgi:hypothetical protein
LESRRQRHGAVDAVGGSGQIADRRLHLSTSLEGVEQRGLIDERRGDLHRALGVREGGAILAQGELRQRAVGERLGLMLRSVRLEGDVLGLLVEGDGLLPARLYTRDGAELDEPQRQARPVAALSKLTVAGGQLVFGFLQLASQRSLIARLSVVIEIAIDAPDGRLLQLHRVCAQRRWEGEHCQENRDTAATTDTSRTHVRPLVRRPRKG